MAAPAASGGLVPGLCQCFSCCRQVLPAASQRQEGRRERRKGGSEGSEAVRQELRGGAPLPGCLLGRGRRAPLASLSRCSRSRPLSGATAHGRGSLPPGSGGCLSPSGRPGLGTVWARPRGWGAAGGAVPPRGRPTERVPESRRSPVQPLQLLLNTCHLQVHALLSQV